MAESLPTWGGWDSEVQNDPYPLFASMRAQCPVHHVRLGDGHDAWLVVGYDAARQALRDPRLSKDMIAAMDADPGVVDEGLPGPAFARHMLAVDPPDHTRLRRVVSRAFAPSRIAKLEPSIERIAHDLLDELEESGPVVDLVEGYALPLPFRVIGELLGLNERDQAPLLRAFRTLFQPWNGSPPPEAVAASDTIVHTLEQLVDSHRAVAADDLIGVLLRAGDDDQLTQQELLSSLFQLIVAGHDTTTSLIGNGLVALLDHPEQLRLLRDDPTLVPGAIEELIRFSPPVPHATFRVTTAPVELDGTTIPAHQQVLVCIGAANREASVREDPDQLDVTRPPRQHLGFGHGIHFCLGAALARLEGRVAFTALLDRFPQIELAAPRRTLRWSHGDGLVLRGLTALPVQLFPDPPSHQQPNHVAQPKREGTTMTITTDDAVDNGVNTAALLDARNALTDAPDAAEFTWRSTTRWVHGTYSRSSVSGFSGLGQEHTHDATFVFEADHPACFASEDRGATPVEIVLSALGSCLTAGVAAVAQNRGIQLRSVTASVAGTMNILGILGADPDIRNGFSDVNVSFDIDADATPEDLDALVAQSQKRSAVFDIMTNPTRVVVTNSKSSSSDH
jgi:cytochrome P450/uncharacterized OsmC-like protein